MAFTVQGIKNITGGTLVQGPADRVLVSGICTDSRKVEPGCVFFALSGESFDGNDFAGEAARKGAGAVVVSREVEVDDKSCAVIRVQDVLRSLQDLAKWWRERLQSLLVVGVTGSSGKTSTKDLLVSVLKQQFRVTATRGNFNNHIGLPLSVLSAEPSDQAAVWEMGMNHPGELEPLCDISKPAMGVITSIGTAHMEYMGSREAIADEKCTLARCLPESGVMVYPADCDFAPMIRQNTKARCIEVGFDKGDVRAEIERIDADGTKFRLLIDGFCNEEVLLPLHGKHMVSNALLAAAIGWASGMNAGDIVRGLEEAELTGGRLKCMSLSGVQVIDDTYNANPESMEAALSTVASMECSGRRWAVLGGMGELGDYLEEAHRRVAKAVCQSGIDYLVTIGEMAEGITKEAMTQCPENSLLRHHFKTKQDAADWLSKEISSGDLVLFKGSRSAGMDELISSIFSTS